MLGDGHVKRLSVERVFNGAVHRCLRDADCLCSNADSAAVESVHRDLEAEAGLANQVLVRNETVFINQRRRRAAANTELVFFFAQRKAFRVVWHHKTRNALKMLISRAQVNHFTLCLSDLSVVAKITDASAS